MSRDPGARRRVGRVLLYGAVVLIVAGGAAAGALALTGGDDPDDDREGDRDGISGPAIDGAGYAYGLPDGWSDITDEALANNLPEGVDSVSAAGDSFRSAQATVIVERFEVTGSTSISDLRRSWEENLASGSKTADPTYLPSLDIDGEKAIGRQLRRKLDNGDVILQLAYLVIHDDHGYSIGLNATEGDTVAGEAFDEVLSSWIWDQG